jgi:hypothetical protein
MLRAGRAGETDLWAQFCNGGYAPRRNSGSEESSHVAHVAPTGLRTGLPGKLRGVDSSPPEIGPMRGMCVNI